MSESATIEKPSPYEELGGATAVRRLANAFYDIMDTNPDFQKLRAMHESDLTPTRDSLTGFLTVWLGGPRDWLQQRGGFCIMSRHAKMQITPETATQWMTAMRQAITTIQPPTELAAKMDTALGQLADAMSRSAAG